MATATWKYSPKDATSLAAFRWLANAIENLSIELYATSPATFPAVEKSLRRCLEDLTVQRNELKASFNAEECPDGYVLCRGLCMPSCEENQ
jgi:hypothetical protein